VKFWNRALSLSLLTGHLPFVVPGQTPVFRSTTNLQSIAVQVIDPKGNFVPGLTAADFTLLEDGKPQKIAFFGDQHQPLSLAIVLDASRSMDFDQKFDRARDLIAPLIAGQHPNDQIFLMSFSDHVETFKELTTEERHHPKRITIPRSGIDRGTALYDALASALCRMRNAESRKQVVVLLTDGADQHSRLTLQPLVELARMSTPQVFMIGFFNRTEAQLFKQGGKTATLLGERQIDNPIFAFDVLSKESGAEAFFPVSDRDLKAALGRISEMLQAQYTLAYYPENVERFRRIEVRAKRRGVKTIARHGIGGASGQAPVIFNASACEVSVRDHPYPWELKSRLVSGALTYHEDFTDANSGWPNRSEHFSPELIPLPQKWPVIGPGSYSMRYVSGGYKMSNHPPPGVSTSSVRDGVVAAYGPAWHDFQASVSVASDWTVFRTERTPNPKDDLMGLFEVASGLVFHLSYEGYHALVLSGGDLKLAMQPGEDMLSYFRLRRQVEMNIDPPPRLREQERKEYLLEKLRVRYQRPHFELLYRQWLQDEGRLKIPTVECFVSLI
jgi:Ca-activated chloride channel family protein